MVLQVSILSLEAKALGHKVFGLDCDMRNFDDISDRLVHFARMYRILGQKFRRPGY